MAMQTMPKQGKMPRGCIAKLSTDAGLWAAGQRRLSVLRHILTSAAYPTLNDNHGQAVNLRPALFKGQPQRGWASWVGKWVSSV